jgi:hypothetical protein
MRCCQQCAGIKYLSWGSLDVARCLGCILIKDSHERTLIVRRRNAEIICIISNMYYILHCLP